MRFCVDLPTTILFDHGGRFSFWSILPVGGLLDEESEDWPNAWFDHIYGHVNEPVMVGNLNSLGKSTRIQ